MEVKKQYAHSNILEYLTEKKEFRFEKNMKKQVRAISGTPFEWLDTEEALCKAVEDIKTCLLDGCNTLGVDLEYHEVERKAVMLCLIQMSTCDKDYIVDSLVLRKDKIQRSGLPEIFADSRFVKIFHGSDSDLQLLASDLGILTNNVFDTARAYQHMQRMPGAIQDQIMLIRNP